MEFIRVRNLRSIKDSGDIPIKPLTLSVGSNSSGKSTLLRLFPLLRQSIATRTTGPILWNGDYVDFGSFEESLRRGSDSESIDLTFTFKPEISNTIRFVGYLSRKAGLPESYTIKIRTRINIKGKESTSSLRYLSFNVCGQSVLLELGRRGNLTSARINHRDIPEIREGLKYEKSDSFLPTIQRESTSRTSSRRSFDTKVNNEGPAYNKLHNKLDSLLHGGIISSTLNDLIGRFIIGNDKRVLRNMRNIRQDLSSWEDLSNRIDTNSEIF